MEEYFGEILQTYEHPLIWMFLSNGYNRMYMYGNKDEPDETFFVFYKRDNVYFLDIGSCYEYGDYDYCRFDFLGYESKITRQVKFETDGFQHLLEQLHSMAWKFGNGVEDYEILDKDSYIEGYEHVIKDDKHIWYKLDEDICFADANVKQIFVEEFINRL